MRQVLSGRAKADGWDAFFAGVVAAVGAKAVLGKFWIVAGFPDFLQDFLDVVLLGIIVPAWEKALTLDFLICIALLAAYGKRGFGRKLRIFLFQLEWFMRSALRAWQPEASVSW